MAERDRNGRVESVIVGSGLRPAEAIALLELDGRCGFTDMDADDLARFEPIDEITIPSRSGYRIADVDPGAEYLDVTPDDALPRIAAAGRSPLTIEEGIALVAENPWLLRERRCFSLLGSRCADRRVPALWVSKDGRPRLGWCWAGNPHSWLGSASCAARSALG